MTQSYFLKDYPLGISADIQFDQYDDLLQVFKEFTKRWSSKPAYSCMGRTISYKELDQLSDEFCSWLQQETGLEPGDKVAIQLPNILQFPIVFWGIVKAGMVVVNTNPLYTDRELIHQFNDSETKLLIVYAGMAQQALRVQPQTPLQKIVVTEIADVHKGLKRPLLNFAVKYIKKMVPAYDQKQVVKYRSIFGCRKTEANWVEPKPEDMAVLQYTGGTTGVAKGAMLTHKNLTSNMLQCQQFFDVKLEEGKETFITPLPLYHIYALLVHAFVLGKTGNHNILIPNPRDIEGFIAELKQRKYTGFAGLNTLFVGLMNHPEFKTLDFSHLKFSLSGGMALQHKTYTQWLEITGSEIYEGYGMTETSPVIAFNPPGAQQVGSIGVQLPGTEIKVIDDQGNCVDAGTPGELCVRGPQVMTGYWKRPNDTDKVMTDDGFLLTGDIVVLQSDGYIRIVDRKKDMIVVSGFNVFPNEIEDILCSHPEVLESCVVGVNSDKTGEAVKAFVVLKNPLEDQELINFCKQSLAAYKVPRLFERRTSLPKSNVGKVIRRELR